MTLDIQEQVNALDEYVAVESEVVKDGGCCEGGQCFNPIPEAHILLVAEGESPGMQSLTDAMGHANFDELTKGTYTLEVSAPHGTEMRTVRFHHPGRSNITILFKE